MSELKSHFLQENPGRARLLRAVAANHREWMIYSARAAGGEVCRENGAVWAYTPGEPGEGAIPFPRMRSAAAGAALDAILDYCRERPLRNVSCWSLSPRPRDLAARLLARGFEWGWQPHWMALDLQQITSDHPCPAGLRIELAEDAASWEVEELPNFRRETAPHLDAMARMQPRRVWHFAARLDGELVGHSLLFVTTGRLGVGGIYSCGVVPAARNRGVGTAVTAAACRQARRAGCRHALLNATPMGEPIYRRIGFESLGFGQTWWLHAPVLAQPPTGLQLALAEAVGRGDLASLERLRPDREPPVLDAPLPCGLTPVAVAVKTRQPASVEWLVRHGATLDLLSAWDLGWKDRLPTLLARSPELVNQRFGDWQITPLHEAAARGDIALARVLLAAKPDLELQDAQFHSTPLGWARHFGHTEIVELMTQHMAASG